jgi:hypothetical protein
MGDEHKISRAWCGSVPNCRTSNVNDRLWSLEELVERHPVKSFAAQIYSAVEKQRLKEPFGPDDVKRACPGWAKRTYTNFMSKHAVGNPSKTTELFERIGRGRYRTLPNLQNSN